MEHKKRLLLLDYASPSTAYPIQHCEAKGTVYASLGLGHSIWAVTGKLAAGTEIKWSDYHGDEAIYVLEGALNSDDAACPARAAILIDANVPAHLRAVEATSFIHFGPVDPVPPAEGPFGAADSAHHAARVVIEADSNLRGYVGPDGTVYQQRFYADSTSSSSRLALFGVSANKASDASVHHHTEDEIIHVLRGEIRVGSLAIKAGMGVAIKANQRYGFTSPGPVEFLNYRRDGSYVVQDGNTRILETASGLPPGQGFD